MSKTIEYITYDSKYPVKCPDCKKTAKNCQCVEYVIVYDVETVKGQVFADNIATDPVRGQQVRVWQPRANARRWSSPTYVDGFLVLTFTGDANYDMIRHAVDAGTFNCFDFKDVEGCHVPAFHKDISRRFGFLRRGKDALRK